MVLFITFLVNSITLLFALKQKVAKKSRQERLPRLKAGITSRSYLTALLSFCTTVASTLVLYS